MCVLSFGLARPTGCYRECRRTVIITEYCNPRLGHITRVHLNAEVCSGKTRFPRAKSRPALQSCFRHYQKLFVDVSSQQAVGCLSSTTAVRARNRMGIQGHRRKDIAYLTITPDPGIANLCPSSSPRGAKRNLAVGMLAVHVSGSVRPCETMPSQRVSPNKTKPPKVDRQAR